MEMKLNDTPFSQLKSGEKTVELRLADEKRSRIRVGDIITFARRAAVQETLCARVVALHRAAGFAALFAMPLFEKCGWGRMSPDEAVAEMRQYYSEAEEAQYGALGIEIELL